jgi:plasmid maintenance system killer protein
LLPAADTKTAPSILWFATIQGIESKQDLAGLAPKDCFIPAKPVERVTGQIGQTQIRLEKMKGHLKAFYSIRINDQWRVIFRWVDGEAHDVRIVDYH